MRVFCLIVYLVFGVFLPSVKAERAGNFEIAITPSSKESSQRTGGDGYSIEKEKSQKLIYRVKITCKGLEKLEDLQVKYLVVYLAQGNYYRDGNNNKRGGAQVIKGDEKIEKFAPLDSIEFTTKEVQNTYQENTWEGGRSSWGKAQLKGIALKIMQGDKVLAEWAKPADMKDYWKRDEDTAPGQKQN